MKSMFIKTDADEMIERINKLTPETQRQWGKMNVCQMMAHASLSVEAAIGARSFKRSFIGRIIGPFAKSVITSDKPFGRNNPTSPEYVVSNPEEFEVEKKKLIDLVQRMYDGGKQGVTDEPHTFFGKLTPTEWGLLIYKHLDHHFRQFGV